MCCYMDDEQGCLIISGADMDHGNHAYVPCPEELLGMDPIVEPFLCADSSTNNRQSSHPLALMDHNVGTELDFLMQEGLIDQDPPKVDIFDELAPCGGFVEDHMFEGCALDLQNDNFHQAAAAAAAFSDMESSQDPLKTLSDLIHVPSSVPGSANEQQQQLEKKSNPSKDEEAKNVISEMGFPPVACEILMSRKSSMSAASSTSNSSDEYPKNEFSSGFHVGKTNCSSLDDTTATSLQGGAPAAFSFQENQGLFSVDSVGTTSCSKPISSLPQAGMGTMRETLYRMAVWRPVATSDSLSKPKRRNVKISNDPQTVAARHRRERISTKIRTLQRLVPGGTKMDTASMLDEAIHYVKYLKSQVRAMELLEQSGESSRNPSSGICHFYPQNSALFSSSSSLCWPMDNMGVQQVNISGY